MRIIHFWLHSHYVPLYQLCMQCTTRAPCSYPPIHLYMHVTNDVLLSTLHIYIIWIYVKISTVNIYCSSPLVWKWATMNIKVFINIFQYQQFIHLLFLHWYIKVFTIDIYFIYCSPKKQIHSPNILEKDNNPHWISSRVTHSQVSDLSTGTSYKRYVSTQELQEV
jgi:hypothetical protein